MPELNCSVATCFYNKAHRCCLPSIEVGGRQAKKSASTCCESFSENENTSAVNCCDRPAQNCVEIGCEAKHCNYNADGFCHAEHVKVAGPASSSRMQTVCETFVCGDRPQEGNCCGWGAAF